MSYRYGEAFERLGIPGMGHQGATWCGINPSGILVLMAHEKYVYFRNGPRRYETPVHGIAPPRSPSAIRSLAILGEYFAPDKPIILAVAVFTTDGSYKPDGTWEPSEFKHATGDAYDARMKTFNIKDGYLLCHLERKFSY